MDRYFIYSLWLPSEFSGKDVGNTEEFRGALSFYRCLQQYVLEISTRIPFLRFNEYHCDPLVGPRWYFAIQAVAVHYQICSPEWSEITKVPSSNEGEMDEATPPVGACVRAVEEFEKERLETSALNDLEEAAECLHLLADKLPPPGRALLDVVWVVGRSVRLPEGLPVIGALKRMHAWHKAAISIMPIAHENPRQDEKVDDHIRFYLDAECKSDAHDVISSSTLWRGTFQLRVQRAAPGIELPGFVLKFCEPSHPVSVSPLPYNAKHPHVRPRGQRGQVHQYFDPSLELIQVVDVSSIPQYLFTNIHLQLSVEGVLPLKRSRCILQHFSSLPSQVGVILYLGCTITIVPAPPPIQLSYLKWKAFMGTKVNQPAAPNTFVKGRSKGLFFCLRADEHHGCLATLLYSANHINGTAPAAIFDALYEVPKEPASADFQTSSFLSKLCSFHVDDLITAEKRLGFWQSKTLHRWTKSDVDGAAVASSSLSALLSASREEVLLKIMQTLPFTDSSVALPSSERPTSSQLDFHPAKCPEWQAIKNHDVLERLKRKLRFVLPPQFASPVSMVPSSKTCHIGLQPQEVLRLFTPEGLPVKSSLPPLKVGCTPGLTEEMVRSMSFNDLLHCRFHGVDFCVDDGSVSPGRALSMPQLLARCQSIETASFCSDPARTMQSHGPRPPSPTVQPSMDHGLSSTSDTEGKSTGGLSLLRRGSTDSFCSHSSLCPGPSDGESATSSRPSRNVPSWKQMSQNCKEELPSCTSKACVAEGASSVKTEVARQKESRSQRHTRMLQGVVNKVLKKHGMARGHACYSACSKRLFDICKVYLKDLKTSHGLQAEMVKAAQCNVQQVVSWITEKH
uniref:mdm2-binding protein-like isoform X2 n=1 Tax=Myxine glutinosa TaxID=7769 RepID=UPI00358F37E1